MLPEPGLFAFLPNMGPTEMIVVMGIAVLLFGKRLPEVGRSLGRGIIEFKKGLNGMGDEFDLSSTSLGSSSSSSARRYDDTPRAPSSTSSSHYGDTSVPKFEPPTSAPVPQMEYEPGAEKKD
jgi:sec-independent protein translocase protein TatA